MFMMDWVTGKEIAEKIADDLKKKILFSKQKLILKIFLVGDDPASQIYVKKKQEFCRQVGIETQVEKFTAEVSFNHLKKKLLLANQSKILTAILIQLPLPQKLSEKKVLALIDPKKDADCLHPKNFGLFCQYGFAQAPVLPATALAVMKILKKKKIKLSGCQVTIVGNSNIVGKPLAMMLSEAGATVVLCQKKTKNLAQHTLMADIVITATGVKGLIKKNMLKKGVGIIDIGITREGKKVFGDVDLKEIDDLEGWITPVPGGVGPVTVAVLAENVWKLSLKNQRGKIF